MSRNCYLLLNSVWHRSGSTLPLVPDGTNYSRKYTFIIISDTWNNWLIVNWLWTISLEVLKISMRIVYKKITLYEDIAVFCWSWRHTPANTNINVPYITIIIDIPNWVNQFYNSYKMKSIHWRTERCISNGIHNWHYGTWQTKSSLLPSDWIYHCPILSDTYRYH